MIVSVELDHLLMINMIQGEKGKNESYKKDALKDPGWEMQATEDRKLYKEF